MCKNEHKKRTSGPNVGACNIVDISSTFASASVPKKLLFQLKAESVYVQETRTWTWVSKDAERRRQWRQRLLFTFLLFVSLFVCQRICFCQPIYSWVRPGRLSRQSCSMELDWTNYTSFRLLKSDSHFWTCLLSFCVAACDWCDCKQPAHTKYFHAPDDGAFLSCTISILTYVQFEARAQFVSFQREHAHSTIANAVGWHANRFWFSLPAVSTVEKDEHALRFWFSLPAVSTVEKEWCGEASFHPNAHQIGSFSNWSTSDREQETKALWYFFAPASPQKHWEHCNAYIAQNVALQYIGRRKLCSKHDYDSSKPRAWKFS